MDSYFDLSWEEMFGNIINKKYKRKWFFNHESRKINYFLSPNPKPIVPFNDRNDKIVMHGGGWGIGNYKDAINVIKMRGDIELEIAAYENADISSDIPKNHNYHLIDPDWKPWEKLDGKFIYPPYINLTTRQREMYNLDYHKLYDFILESKAIITKTGGATILDSISAATPIIFTEPFGDSEAKNQELLRNLNIGISFNEWEHNNFSFDILKNMHDNIKELRKSTKNIIFDLI